MPSKRKGACVMLVILDCFILLSSITQMTITMTQSKRLDTKLITKGRYTMKKIISCTLAFALIASILAGCSAVPTNSNNSTSSDTSSMQPSSIQEEAPKDDHYPVTIKTHNYAREEIEVTFDEAPQKVLTYGLNSVENMIELGLEDHIVYAMTNKDNILPRYQEASTKIPQINKEFISKEKALELQPDFIYAWYSSFADDRLNDVDFWHERDVNTYMAYNSGLGGANNLENEFSDILNLGKIFNVEDRAEAVVAEMKAKIAQGQEFAKGKEPINIAILETTGDVWRVYGEDTIGGDIAMQVGANLVAKDKSVKLSKENLVELNPDMIFSVHFGPTSTSLNDVDALAVFDENPVYANLSAFKNDTIHPTDLSFVYSPGVRVLDSLDFFLETLYGQSPS